MNHVQPVNSSQVAAIRELLQSKSASFAEKQYSVFEAKLHATTITVYEKGPKIMLQGKDISGVLALLQPLLDAPPAANAPGSDPQQLEPHFGIDESGKGDYFGPLVIAGVYTERESALAIAKAGVMDSKTISNPAKIRELAAVIRATPGIQFQMAVLTPETYNSMYRQIHNLNTLLARGHANVILGLSRQVPDCHRSLSDQFSAGTTLVDECRGAKIPPNVKIDQRTKAESDTAVAAASILAREAFINWIDAKSQELGLNIPLGAGDNATAMANQLAKAGNDMARLVKSHFKNSQLVSA